MAIEYRTRPISEILKNNKEQKLVLPNFQRDYVWDRDLQRKLAVSALMQLPIGSILFLVGSRDEFSARSLGEIRTIIPSIEEVYYLLDGQQRISTIRAVFSDVFEEDSTPGWRDKFDHVFSKLRYRWFLKITVPKESEDDPFGYKFLEPRFMNKLENPDDLVDYLIPHKILKGRNNLNKFFHPEMTSKILKNREKRRNFVDACVEDSLIPLFYLGENDQKVGLVRSIINSIAASRAQQLANEYLFERSQELTDVLEKFVLDFNIEGDDKHVRSSFTSLAHAWSEKLFESIKSVMNIDIPIVQLENDELSRSIAIFDSMNTGGTPLSTFDLVAAKIARTGATTSLSESINVNLNTQLSLPKYIFGANPPVRLPDTIDLGFFGLYSDRSSIDDNFKNAFLNLLSLFNRTDGDPASAKIDHIKRSEILSIAAERVNELWQVTAECLKRAYSFLVARCGVSSFQEFPYKLMVLPIAFHLKKDDLWNNLDFLNKLEAWYWTSIFGGYYREKQNERCIKDIIFINNLKEDASILNERKDEMLKSQKYSDEKTFLPFKDIEGNNVVDKDYVKDNPLPKSIRYTFFGFILRRFPVDFLKKERMCAFKKTSQEHKYDYHHIIPLGSATTIGQSSRELRSNIEEPLNNVLNLTPILQSSNSEIKAMALPRYIDSVSLSSRVDHFLPEDESFYEKFDEMNNDKKVAFLRRRFNSFKNHLRLHVDSLLPID